ncbi:MAG: NosD domain-containing protein [Candidatus Heimdallarchaeota archaeon]
MGNSLPEGQPNFRGDGYQYADQGSPRQSSSSARSLASYETHSPIYIDGNQDFLAQASAGNWPGDGSFTSPYFIEGFNISGSSGPHLIGIRNVDVFFRIRNCWLGGGDKGIFIYNTSNLQISRNTVANTLETGIELVNSKDNTVSGNLLLNNGGGGEFGGIGIFSSTNSSISNNSIISSTWSGIYLHRSGNSSVSNNSVFGAEMGISLYYSGNTDISDNIVTNNDLEGIILAVSPNSYVSANRLIQNGDSGISLSSSRNTILKNNAVTESGGDGISLQDSHNNIVFGNIVSSNSQSGLFLGSSGNNNISSNLLANNSKNGLYLDHSGNNRINNNVFVNNSLLLGGSNVENYLQAEVVNNSVNNRPLIYWQDRTGGLIPQDGGQFILVNCTRVTIAGHILSDTSTGILAAYSADLLIHNNNISRTRNFGINVQSSENITISDNFLKDSEGQGIFSQSSNGISVTGNTITKLSGNGILLESTENSTISDNSVTDLNGIGISLDFSPRNLIFTNILTNNSEWGIFVGSSANTNISENTIVNIKHSGILLVSSGESTISRNVVEKSAAEGIALTASPRSSISGNFISNNGKAGIFLSISGANKISDNYLVNNGLVIDGPSLGNYLQVDVSNNSVNSKPLIYWQDLTRGTVPDGAGQVILVHCTAVTVSNQTLSNTSTGIQAAYSWNLYIHDNLIFNNSGYGISLIKVEDSVIEWNEFIDNNPNGTSQAYDDGTNNTFAYNFWNDWTDPDNNRDGLVDLPYPIDGTANNQDLSPRIFPMHASARGLPDQIMITVVLVGLILGALGISIWRQRQ